jgi:hypothetical protein
MDTAEVSAAMASSTKNSTPNRSPKGMAENTAGRVMKVSPGPALGAKPKANTAGSTIRPERKAAVLSTRPTVSAEDGRFSRSDR